MSSDLAQEERRLSELLAGKIVKIVKRHRNTELLLEFTDGTRLYVDCPEAKLEMSVTGGPEPL
jgi:hypothetical protein